MARSNRLSSRIDVVIFGACVLLALIATVLPARMRDPAASLLRRTLVAPLLRLQQGSERWRAAYQSSVREELRRDTLALAAARVPALESENDRLRKVLGLGSSMKWGFIPAEALSARGRTEDFTIVLSAGSKAGVRERSLVVAPEGIVGLVQTVDPSMSVAILFAHPDFRVSAMSADGNAFGIVQPRVTGSATPREQAFMRSERYLLELRGVSFRAALKPGAVIYSSGMGGVYPKGIPVGVVLGEIQTPENFQRTYILRPAVNPAELSSVMILTPQRATAGVANVWADVGAVDVVTRGIVLAGDSLARQAAAAEAAARRAAIDSAARILRDSLGRDTTRTDTTAAVAPIDPAVAAARARARRDSAAARARRDSIRRAADTPIATPTPTTPPVNPR
ncbi:MAG: rod shape-determining protein MreC [Gemmatimonadaceae bacterium]|nr:rod shape-determining protein MreC [Gemmatimonadaceae bacterium]NUS31449.1 rod shape-determining protein MreC [Gemmatimonadaceae bacterium]